MAAEQLLARFLAAPSEDEELPVLADALAEAGDPRGELIALQLAPSTPAIERKVAKLVKAHRAHLLGDLAGVVGEVQFRRGFVARADIIAPPGKTLADPRWATVEHLEGKLTAAHVEHAVMRSLRSLAFPAISIAKLATYPWLEQLAVRAFDEASSFGKRGSFPALRALTTHLTYAHSAGWDFEELMASPILKRLSRLVIDVAIGTDDLGIHGLDPGDLVVLPRWLERLAKLPLEVTLATTQGKVTTRYRFTPDTATVTIPRFPKAFATDLRASVEPLIALTRTLRASVEVVG